MRHRPRTALTVVEKSARVGHGLEPALVRRAVGDLAFVRLWNGEQRVRRTFPFRWDPVEGLALGAWTSQTGVMELAQLQQWAPAIPSSSAPEAMLSAAYNLEAGGLTIQADDGALRVLEHLSWCPSGACTAGILTGPGSLR